MIRLINASAHNTGLQSGSVHCVVTSPPYWGLRAYAGEQAVDWPEVEYNPMPGMPAITIPTMRCGLGEEPTPEAFIGHLVLVMRELWRVLRDDGTCWVNLGDSYASQGGPEPAQTKWQVEGASDGQNQGRSRNAPSGLKPKDLCLIPARFALAAQAEGWWVRSDIIWAKPNPMPESVTDRPTKAHEYIYLLAKSQRYFYDAEAVKEETSPETFARARRGVSDNHKNVNGAPGQTKHTMAGTRAHGEGYPVNPTRNRRTVWNIATRPYSGAHFATWPPDLVRPMILAGTSARGVCPACGAPWERVIEKPDMTARPTRADDAKMNNGAVHISNGWEGTPKSAGQAYQDWRNANPNVTTGWRATCTCPPHEPIPATVLDPFNGSGTTGTVALDLGQAYIGVDIAGEYVHELAEERIGGTQIGFGL